MHRLITRLAPVSALAAVLMAPGAASAAVSLDDAAGSLFGDMELVLEQALPVPAGTDAEAGLGGAAATSQAVAAAAPPAIVLPAAPRDPLAMSDEELGAQRGGFMTPLGLEVGFGAIVRTTIDNALVLETRLTLSDEGVSRMASAGGASLTPDQITQAALSGINVGPGFSGVVTPGDSGATAVLHDVTGNSITNLVINTANNRVIRQDTEITLNIPAFAQFQQQALGEALRLRLDGAMSEVLGALKPR